MTTAGAPRWQVRKIYPGKDWPWAATREGFGIQPKTTWQEAMDFANGRARGEIEARRDHEIFRANGWPELAGIDFYGRANA